MALHHRPPAGHPRSSSHGRTGPRRFKFAPVARPPSIAGTTPPDYPFTLVFGHSLYYWHQNVLIQHSETLSANTASCCSITPMVSSRSTPTTPSSSASATASKIRLRAAGGSAVPTARVTPEVRSGTVFVPVFRAGR